MRKNAIALACTAVLAALIFLPATLSGVFAPSSMIDDDVAAANNTSNVAGPSDEGARPDSGRQGDDAAAPDGANEGEGQGASPEGGPGYEPDVVIVEIADVLSLDEVNAELATLDFVATDRIDASDVEYGFVELQLAEGVSVDDAIARMDEVEFAAYAQPNYVYHLLDDGLDASADADTGADLAPVTSPVIQEMTAQAAAVNDPQVSQQWALTAVKAFGAWDYARSEHKVTVAIVDGGLDMDHPDFADANGRTNVIGGCSVLENGNPRDYDDTQGHGTHVAGIVAAGANNGVGVAGVTYNANIMPVKIFADPKKVTSRHAAAGINYVVDYAKAHPDASVKVINLSFGTDIEASKTGDDDGDEMLKAALTRAHDADMLVVFAAGNGAGSSMSSAYNCYPCDSDPEGIGVINVEQNGTTYARYVGSNFNKEGQRTKELSAPGTKIYSTIQNGSYGSMGGTSMAAPYVSGVAALVFAANPNKTAEEVKQILIDTATDLNTSENIAGEGKFDLQTGYGLVNAEGAVKEAMGAGAAYLSEGDALMIGGASLQLSVLNAAGLTWTWSSSNTSVATVGADGVILPVSAGTATITATLSDGTTLYRNVYVYDPTIEGPSTVEVGASITLTVPASGNPTSSWVWSSSDENAAKVGATSGEVTGLSAANKVTITVKLYGNDAITCSKDITVAQSDKKNIANATVKFSQTNYTFDGIEKKPTVTCKYSGSDLKEGTDFTVKYPDDCTNAGAKTVTVIGKGDFEGSEKKMSYTIGKRSATVTAKSKAKVYDGTALTAAATGYTTSGFVGNDASGVGVALGGQITNVGSTRATVTCSPSSTVKNNYNITTVSGTLTVTAASLARCTVSLSPTSATYTGSALTPSVTVKDGTRVLRNGSDYTVSYSNNTNVGTGTVTVTGKGNYTGTRASTFTIVAARVTVWRLYDTRTGEHHYTSDANERKVLIGRGNWNDEGTAWVTPSTSSTPVYRVYDLWTGEHHYTSDANEKKVLVGSGRWRDEGIAWYSDDAKTCKVYRVERHDRGPLQHHHYTINANERNVCIKQWGWNDEGIGWYALSAK